jgi:hypothetical protein
MAALTEGQKAAFAGYVQGLLVDSGTASKVCRVGVQGHILPGCCSNAQNDRLIASGSAADHPARKKTYECE